MIACCSYLPTPMHDNSIACGHGARCLESFRRFIDHEPHFGHWLLPQLSPMHIERADHESNSAGPDAGSANKPCPGRLSRPRMRIGPIIYFMPTGPKRCYPVGITDAGSTPCSTTTFQETNRSRLVFFCPFSPVLARVRASLRRTPLPRTTRLRAVFRSLFPPILCFCEGRLRA